MSEASIYKVISTPNAPAALGPYSQGIRSGDFIFLAGQLGLVGNTGELIPGGIEKQTEQALKNMEAILASQKLGLNSIVKTTVFLSDLNHFTAMNAVYAKFFHHDHPARSTVQVARLPKDALVEIEAIARAHGAA